MATTPLDDNRTGIGVRKFKDYNSTQVSQAISRHQYHEGMKNNEKVRRFSEAVYAMVSKWSMEDKILLLKQYGEASRLPKRPTEDEINTALTEAIIVNLDQADLKKLIGDVIVSQRQFAQDIRKTQQRSRATSLFNARNFEKYFQMMVGVHTNRQYMRRRRRIMPGFMVPRYISSRYRSLRRELDMVLRTYFTAAQVETFAINMGIAVFEGMNLVDVRQDIINKTLLYVDLVMGTNPRNNLSGVIMDPKPYNDLLIYTSFAYVTGQPGLDEKTVQALRRQARLALEKQRAQARAQSEMGNVGSDEFRRVSGQEIHGIFFRNSRARAAIEQEDKGILKDATIDELKAYALKYGIDIARRETIATLKLKIYRHMAAAQRRRDRANIDYTRSYSRNPLSIDTEITKSRVDAYTSLLNGPSAKKESETSDKIPVVSFKEDGSIKNVSIMKAVPVYIVGEGISGDIFMKNLISENKIKDSAGNRFLTSKEDKPDRPLETGYEEEESEYRRSILDRVGEGLREGQENQLFTLFNELMDRLEPELDSSILNTIRSRTEIDDKDSLVAAIDQLVYLESVLKGYDNIAYDFREMHFTDKSREKNYFGKTEADIHSIAQNTPSNISIPAAPDYSAPITDLIKNTKGIYDRIKRTNTYLYNANKILQDETNKILKSETNLHLETIEDYMFKLVDPILGLNKQISDDLRSVIESVGISPLTSNQNLSLPWGSGGTNSGGAGPTNRDILIDEYRKRFGQNSIDSDGLVNIGDNEKVAQDIDAAVGRQASYTSKFPKKGKYRPTKATLEWALRNGIAFDSTNQNNTEIIEDSENPQDSADIKKKNAVRTITVHPNVINTSNAAVIGVEARSAGLKELSVQPVIPVFVTNDILNTDSVSTDAIVDSIDSLKNIISGFSSYSGIAQIGTIPVPMSMMAPAVATLTAFDKAQQTALQLLQRSILVQDAKMNYPTANTGAKITRFATGGTAAITGDSSKADIFANGAKPELVQSTGDMTVQPLNRAGTENRQKVSRLSTAERRNALATAISSHVVKFNYQLPGTTELSNTGEAIKVYNVKPGIADPVETQNGTFSVMDLLSGIYGLLVEMNASESSQIGLLGEIAKNTIPTSSGGSAGSSPFTGGFPDSLDGILSGI